MNDMAADTIELSTKQTTQPEKFEGLFVDTCMLLERRMFAHMAPWAYVNGGRPHLERFFSSPDYDGTRESALLPLLGAQFYNDLPNEISLIELGPGKAHHKTINFIDAFNRAANGQKEIVEYQALDIVPDYACSAAATIKTRYNVRTKSIVADYNKLVGPMDSLSKKVMISWNSPVWNASIVPDMDPDFTYADKIKRVGHLVGRDGGIFITTHFPLRTPEETRKIYNSDDCRLAVLAIPSLIEKALSPLCTANGKKVNFSDLFDYRAVINLRDSYTSMNIVPKENAVVRLGDMEVVIEKGKPFELVRSAKPDIGRFNAIAGLAKANIINTLQNQAGDVVGQMLKFG